MRDCTGLGKKHQNHSGPLPVTTCLFFFFFQKLPFFKMLSIQTHNYAHKTYSFSNCRCYFLFFSLFFTSFSKFLQRQKSTLTVNLSTSNHSVIICIFFFSWVKTNPALAKTIKHGIWGVNQPRAKTTAIE